MFSLSILIQLLAGLIFILSLVAGHPTLPTTLTNTTSGSVQSSFSPDGLLTDTARTLISQRGIDTNNAHAEYTNVTFIIEDCNHAECPRSCETDARVALWQWRNMCDRGSKLAKAFLPACWGKAPHPDKCCVPKGQKKPASCGKFWPKTDHEAAICRHNCLWLKTGTCTASKFNPDWCRCMYKNCKSPTGLSLPVPSPNHTVVID